MPRVRPRRARDITQPAVWNSGMALTWTRRDRMPRRAVYSRALLTIPRWCSTAPLGKPVVPEVYWICAGAGGLTSGSARSGVPSAQNASQSANGIASRSAGRSPRTCCNISAIGLAAVLRDQEDPGRARLAQHVRQLPRPQRGVDRHQGHAGQAGGQLQHHPLGDVVGPDRDAVARGEAAQQRPGGALGRRQQLGVAPAPPGRRIGDSLDERGGEALAAAPRRASPTVRSTTGCESRRASTRPRAS